jgi:hypothetical protein
VSLAASLDSELRADRFPWREMFTSIEVAVVRRGLETACAAVLGADPVAILDGEARLTHFAFTLALDDDTTTELALHPAWVSREHLAATTQLGAQLLGGTSPAFGPERLGLGHLTFRAPSARASLEPAHLAQSLAELVREATRRAGSLPLGDVGLLPTGGERWGRAVAAREARVVGAEGLLEVQELADLARARFSADDAPRVVGPLTLAPRSGAALDLGPVCDLARVDEAALLGQAAATFRGPSPPNPDESDRFVAAYVEARGAPLDERERRSVGAHRTHRLATQALAEMSLDRTPARGSAEELLLRFGERFLLVRG